MSKPAFLGKLLLHWCETCNVPVLGKRCGCGNATKKVEVTPPGDIRPAFPYDIRRINSVSEKQFNTPLIPEGKLVVLNKAPYDDRMDEIIVDGNVVASIRFEIESCEWVLLPRLAGARRLFQGKDRKELKKWVILDEEILPFILKKGASILVPGVLDADPEIQTDDEVVVLLPSGEVVSCGRARMSGRQMLDETRGNAVKPRWSEEPKPFILPEGKNEAGAGARTWDDAVRANADILDNFTGEAHAFIKNVVESMDKPVSVSYSGGKDSLAVLQLVAECLDDYEIMFADTGIEFPETLENVRKVAEYYGKPLRLTSAGEAFWDSIGIFGPPTMDTRWCCKICKLGPITRLIQDNYGKGCLSFIGQRKYESHARSISKRVWKNPWVGNQVGASPIQDWTALHVWLYIFRTKAPYNPAYGKGYDRMGCWLCPSSSLSDFFLLEEVHPELAEKLNSHLLAYAEKTGLSEEWVKYGLWRYKRFPQPLEELARKRGIALLPKHANPDTLTFEVATGYRPCKAGGLTADGSFGQPIDLDTLDASGMLRAIGKTASIEGMISANAGEDRVQIYASGNVNGRSENNEKRLKKLMRKVEFSVRRGLLCKGCGVCVGHCDHEAIEIRDGKAVITDACIHCGACIEVCPLARFI
ncbi:MAG: phosphoadenosine phosphosulfate reductase family protein [Methanosarcinaceae archaeon]|nr:phosphoadenosine phosphosulfate reductase family protein [Methanosarcinaceae archaeon]MDD4498087.1 phosphoadenosine phosphosulfate reductase family protein [Methanosarcinaceae archaeon]